MKMGMNGKISQWMLGLAMASLPLFVAGCGGGAGGGGNLGGGGGAQTGSVSLSVSDGPTEDWANIGIKILSISLNPQGGGSAVNIYTVPTPAPTTNLVQLDQLSEILANATVPVGTYTAATLVISANPGDVMMTSAADPETGFAAGPTAAVSATANNVQIVGTSGGSGSVTVSVTVNFISALVVTANQNAILDLEFDLSHPAFIVAHVPTAGSTIWFVNFKGPIRHRLISQLTSRLLRDLYGTANSVSTDNTSLTLTKDFPVYPPTNPETEMTSTHQLTVLADPSNGTIYYDADAKTQSTIMNFSSIASTIGNKFVRVAVRYQANGTLVAVRMWASTSFNSVWQSPEGHVLHVNTTSNILTVQNELGQGVPVTVNANTQFFFRTPATALSDATAIGTGPGFLSNIKRGFKVHVSAVDPLANPLVAQTVDIETARFDGNITTASTTNFTYNHVFPTVVDTYTVTLPYIANGTANGTDPVSGAALTGFKWWNDTLPTIVNSGGASAISSFATAAGGAANFGGSVGSFPSAGVSSANWNDPNAPNTWSAFWTVFTPTTIPVGTAATAYTNGTFTMAEPGGTLDVPVSLSTTSGSGTLVYQVDRTNNIISVTSVDITTGAGQTTVTNNLLANVPVKVFGVPQANGSIKAYAVFYYTGTKPLPASLGL